MAPGKWRKSSRSQGTGNCVETRTFNHHSAPVEMRDSKAPQLGSLAIDRTEFADLLDSVKLERRTTAAPKQWRVAASFLPTLTLTHLDLLASN